MVVDVDIEITTAAEQSVALGFVPQALSGAGETFEIEILGELCQARVIDKPLFDPDGARMRG